MIIKIVEEKYRCNKCQWEWFSRKEGLPRKCPQCASTMWNFDNQTLDMTVPVDQVKLELEDIDTIKQFENVYCVNLEHYMRNNK